jgi:hypothetical protein
MDQFMQDPELVKARNEMTQYDQALVNARGTLDPNAIITGEAAIIQNRRDVAEANMRALEQRQMQRFGIAQQEQDQLKQLILQTGGKAGIKLTDSFADASEKAGKYQEKKQLADIYTQTFGMPPKKGMKSKDIEKQLKKAAESSARTAAELQSLELMKKRVDLQKAISGGGEKIDYGRAFGGILTGSQGIRWGDDGFVNTQDFMDVARDFIAEGGTWQDIIKSGANNFVDPNDPTAPQFLKTAKQKEEDNLSLSSFLNQ